jgi:hypothetical protein
MTCMLQHRWHSKHAQLRTETKCPIPEPRTHDTPVCDICRVGTSLLHRRGDTAQPVRVLAGAFDICVPCRSTVDSEAAATALRHCATATSQPPVAAAAQQSWAFICEAASARVCDICRVGTSLLHRRGDTAQPVRVLAGASDTCVPCRSTVEAATTALRHCATATSQPPVAAAAQQSWAFICEAARETLGSAGGADSEGVCVCGLASLRSIVVRLGLIKGVESLEGRAETAAFGKGSIRVREQRIGLGFDTCGPCRSTVEAAGTAPRHCATATTQAATSYTPRAAMAGLHLRRHVAYTQQCARPAEPKRYRKRPLRALSKRCRGRQERLCAEDGARRSRANACSRPGL